MIYHYEDNEFGPLISLPSPFLLNLVVVFILIAFETLNTTAKPLFLELSIFSGADSLCVRGESLCPHFPLPLPTPPLCCLLPLYFSLLRLITFTFCSVIIMASSVSALLAPVQRKLIIDTSFYCMSQTALGGGGGSGSSPPPTPPPSPSPTLFSWPKPSLDTDYRPVLVGREVTVGMVTAHHACACLHHCRHRFLVPRSCVSFSHGTVSSLKVGPDFFLFVSPGSSTCLTHRDP